MMHVVARTAKKAVKIAVLTAGVCTAMASAALAQQGGAMGGMNMDANHKVADGGIKVPGWQGMVDANAAKTGATPNDAKFEKTAGGYHVETGPAIDFWDPTNALTGDYTVSATFTEPKFMNLNDHPHPYGLFIAGQGLGTAQQSLLYCAAYGNGTFIVRGFGPAPFQMGTRRPTANEAVHKAAGPSQPVSQTVALQVKDGKVSCIINGTAVATYDKAEVVADGKLKSTDGVWGIRFSHNTEATVTDVKVTK